MFTWGFLVDSHYNGGRARNSAGVRESREKAYARDTAIVINPCHVRASPRDLSRGNARRGSRRDEKLPPYGQQTDEHDVDVLIAYPHAWFLNESPQAGPAPAHCVLAMPASGPVDESTQDLHSGLSR